MDARTLNDYLRKKIPLTRSMGVRVVRSASEQIVLRAPLKPNRNHQHTGFGGSISTLALLAAWSLVHTRLADEGIPHHLVVRRQETIYRRAITGSLVATATLINEADWLRFRRTLQRRRKASIPVVATLEQDGQCAANFRGDFVALVSDETGALH